MNKQNSMKLNYILFLAVGILAFYMSGFLLGVFSDTYGFGIHGFEAVPVMLVIYAVLLAAGLIVSKERSLGFVAKAFAISFAAMFLISIAFFALSAYNETTNRVIDDETHIDVHLLETAPDDFVVVGLDLPDSEDTKENDFTIGPGLPGSADMVYWYVPDSLKDNKLDPSPYFPAISQYSDSMNYTRRTMMTVWYFESSEDLKNGEKELYTYVKEHGELFDDTVDITEQVLEHENNRILGSTNLNVTRYESEETSGYFAVIIKPFLNSLNNYFIIYYGTNEKSLEEEVDTIKNLMAKEYYMANKDGYVRELNDCNVTIEDKT